MTWNNPLSRHSQSDPYSILRCCAREEAKQGPRYFIEERRGKSNYTLRVATTGGTLEARSAGANTAA